MLSIRDLTKSFASPTGEMVAVDRVSFDVQPGEFFTLLGP